MSSLIEVKVPDIGDYKDVPVIEVLVKPGDTVKKEESLVTLESDKATMEVPSPATGVVKEVRIQVGAKVSQGTLILTLEAQGAAQPAAPAAPAAKPAAAPVAAPAAGTYAGAADIECEMLVLGAGPGGYSAAFRAADLRIFVYGRWQEMARTGWALSDLMEFHRDHKLLIMAHSQKHYAELGRLVAGAKQYARKELHEHYLATLLAGLKLLATTRKNTNVLQHMAGYFKQQLPGDEKQELLEVIEQSRKGHVPLVVPLVLIRHYVRKCGAEYLKRQYYLNPHPAELMLRNHV